MEDLSKYTDRIKHTNVGNVIAHFPGEGKKVVAPLMEVINNRLVVSHKGEPVFSGVYLYVVKNSFETKTGKLMIIR